MKIKSWRTKMRLNQEEAARLLFMDVRTLQRKDRLENDDPKLLCVMNYQEMMAAPTIDAAKKLMNKHYRKIRGDHWE